MALLVLLPAVTLAADAPGVAWEGDLDAALARAAIEGRPVLLAINALETESANQRLARELYPDRAWGEATRDWVCLVANPNVHGGGDLCERYGGIPCEAHQATLAYVIRRFIPSGDMISPQHLILDPDERLAWQKEYYTGVVGPPLFERWLGRLSPVVALERAADVRASHIEALEQTPTAALEEAAAAWLASGDPLATAGVLRASDFALDDARRLALIRAFAQTPADQVAIPWIAAYDAAMAPDDDAAAARTWIEAVNAVDPDRGRDLAARAAVRAASPALRRAFLDLLFEGGVVPARLDRAEATDAGRLRLEAFLALGRPVGEGAVEGAGGDHLWRHRLRRAARLPRWPSLEEALDGGASASAGALRGALLQADAERVKARADEVRGLLEERPEERVRIAAALALLGAGLDADGRVVSTVLGGIFDVVESTDARPEAAKRLGNDFGYDEAAWREALRARVEGR